MKRSYSDSEALFDEGASERSLLAAAFSRSHSSEKINKELALRGNAKENKGIESNGGLHLGTSFNQVGVKEVILIGNIRCYLKNL